MATSAPTPHHKFSLHGEHCYLKVAIFSEDGSVPVTDVKQLKFGLDNTLKSAFGVVGASASEFDVLSFEKTSPNSREPCTALLRVQRGGLETLRGAITMCTTLNGKLCMLEVLHMGDSLMDMASGRFL
ncbi:PX domain-containing hypothetical protein kinase [Phytophthora megakarya]|uniref:Ribonuclease P/MRP protein subunit POP5 n=1 Tax=Phytophthora megakarya TaxID=4795 RepID=A0A225X303_9STRA|nr:PX domain-containing hypothetical protein kinase [Phytophthora megakarya]